MSETPAGPGYPPGTIRQGNWVILPPGLTADQLEAAAEQMSRDQAALRQEGWEPGRWWRVLAPDGSLWCETSDEAEARDALRPGDTLWRLWRQSGEQWRKVTT